MLIAKYYISLLELRIKYAAECTTDIKCPIYPFLTISASLITGDQLKKFIKDVEKCI